MNDTEVSDLSELEAFCGEPLLRLGESESDLGAPGWRQDAVAELRLQRSLGLPEPDSSWRARYALAFGLQRLTARDPIRLLDGTMLEEHQVEVPEALLAAIARTYEGDSDGFSANEADPGAALRMWFEHATGSGKTVAACALVDAARSGTVLVLTHRSALVDQFRGELASRGYGDRLADGKVLLSGSDPGPVVVVETYAWLTRHYDEFSPDVCCLTICDEGHMTLGPQTAEALRCFDSCPVVAMTATGTLIARDVADLFPHKVSTFDLRSAAAVGVISPLRGLRVEPTATVQTLRGLRTRAGDYNPDDLARLLDRDLLNHSAAAFYRDTFGDLSGIVYAANVSHANHLATAFVACGVPAAAVSGVTPRGELRRVLEDFEAGQLRVIVNAALLTEGWNSPRVTVCLHLAPTASRRVYQQRIGRVTRRAPGKTAGVVVDFVPAWFRNDEPIVTLHSLLDEPVYRPGALVTHGPSDAPVVLDAPWAQGTPVPVHPDAGRRMVSISSDVWAFHPSRLRDDDRLTWAREAGAVCRNADEIRRAKSLLAFGRDAVAAAEIAALGRAAMSSDTAARAAALDMLETAHTGESFEVLRDGALIEEQPHVARKLVARALRSAADGAPTSHGDVLRLARVERTVFERVAAGDPAYRRVADGHGDIVRRLVGIVPSLSSQVAAAALAATMPVSGDAERLMEQAAEDRWPSARMLADALTTAERNGARPADRALAYSRGGR